MSSALHRGGRRPLTRAPLSTASLCLHGAAALILEGGRLPGLAVARGGPGELGPTGRLSAQGPSAGERSLGCLLHEHLGQQIGAAAEVDPRPERVDSCRRAARGARPARQGLRRVMGAALATLIVLWPLVGSSAPAFWPLSLAGARRGGVEPPSTPNLPLRKDDEGPPCLSSRANGHRLLQQVGRRQPPGRANSGPRPAAALLFSRGRQACPRGGLGSG